MDSFFHPANIFILIKRYLLLVSLLTSLGSYCLWSPITPNFLPNWISKQKRPVTFWSGNMALFIL